MSEKEALLNFIGGVYGQMKEIDNHIAATGSGAKFGGVGIQCVCLRQPAQFP